MLKKLMSYNQLRDFNPKLKLALRLLQTLSIMNYTIENK